MRFQDFGRGGVRCRTWIGDLLEFWPGRIFANLAASSCARRHRKEVAALVSAWSGGRANCAFTSRCRARRRPIQAEPAAWGPQGVAWAGSCSGGGGGGGGSGCASGGLAARARLGRDINLAAIESSRADKFESSCGSQSDDPLFATKRAAAKFEY